MKMVRMRCIKPHNIHVDMLRHSSVSSYIECSSYFYDVVKVL